MGQEIQLNIQHAKQWTLNNQPHLPSRGQAPLKSRAVEYFAADSFFQS